MKTADTVDLAHKWVTAQHPKPPADIWYCATRDVFQVRLETLLSHMQKKIGDDAYLAAAVAGEIGNNSFDHNLGSWPDLPGIFFAADLDEKFLVLADRGQGIRKTIARVKPDIADDKEALLVAFTQVLSGRSPERRGNGLKFVVKVLKERGWSLEFYSGNAKLSYRSGKLLPVEKESAKVFGCLAILSV